MSLVIVFFTFGCKKEAIRNNAKLMTIQESSNSKKTFVNSNVKFIRTLKNNEFKLDIETTFSNDSLDIIDYKNDYCSSPIILDQQLFFYKNDKLLIKYKLPIKYVKKKTIDNIKLNALQISIYKMCLSKTSDKDYYIINGSDCCNGSDCPEFTGIYSMNGEIIYEGLSNEKKKVTLKDVLTKNNIKLNDLPDCVSVEVSKKQ